MNEKGIKIMRELFNYNLEANVLGRLNIIITIFFSCALILTILIFSFPSFIGKIITLFFTLIVWIVGVGYGIFHFNEQAKKLKNHREEIIKLLNFK